MSFESELKTHLDVASVTTHVNDRITPVKLKDNSAMPAAVYSIIFAETQNSLDGFTSGVVRYRVQVDCWGSTFTSQVAPLALAIRDRMNVDATNFKSVIIGSALDDYEPETKRYRRTLEFSCWHTES